MLKLEVGCERLFENCPRLRLAQTRQLCYTACQAVNSFAFIALLARVKPGKLYGEPRFGGCAQQGVSPFVISPGLFQGLTRNPSGDAPSFSVGC